MAVAEENYDDLIELQNDIDELTQNFTKAANHIQNILGSIDKNSLMILYGYYKQATEGPCHIPKPSWFDVKGKLKWDSWNSLGNMSKIEAKKLYIEKIKSIDKQFVVKSEKTPPKIGWVSVSKLVPSEIQKNKTLIDFITEENVEKIAEILKSVNPALIENFVNKLDGEGLGLIHWAADRGSVKVLTLLLLYKADINLEDSQKQTALHYAASCGHLDCVKFLLENGIDVHKKDIDGLEASSVASDKKIKEIICNYNP